MKRNARRRTTKPTSRLRRRLRRPLLRARVDRKLRERALRSFHPNLATGRTASKAGFLAKQKAKGRSPAQAAAAWNLTHKRHAKPRKTTKRAVARAKPRRKPVYTRTYGAQRVTHKRVTVRGGIHTLVGHIGTRKVRTALYRGKKGKIRHVPHWALMGHSSEREYLSVAERAAKGDKRAQSRLERNRLRFGRLDAARKRAAEAAVKRIMAGRDPFVPNRRSTTEEREMLRNARRRRKSTKGRRRARRNIGLMHATRKQRRLVGAALASHHRKASQKRRKRGKTASRSRRRIALRTARKHLRIARGALAHVNRRRRKPRRTVRNRRRYVAVAPNRRRRVHHRRTRRNTGLTPNRRHRRIHANRRHHRRSYRRNAGIMGDVKTALKFGAIAFGGYVVHSALTTLLDQQLAKVASLNSGAIATWRPLISGAVVAAALIPLAAKVSPRNAGVVGAGVGVSFLKRLAYTLLGQAGDTGAKISGYLSAYPDSSGYAYRGYGSYFTVAPRQVYGARPSAVPGPVSGYGDYYETGNAPINVPYGGYGGDVMQAAAGYGAPLLQAAAGMGAPLMQAAAGMGEYEVVPDASMSGFGQTVDGTQPNLMSAEQSLNVMEAAAGFGDLSLQSMINPIMTGVNVPTDPGGSRAGLLAGQDGLFGG